MLNNAIIIKVKQRLNKLDSSDYDNIERWQIIEAFNKGQSDWCRRNLHGANQFKEGDEQSTSRIDDLQVLLVTIPLQIVKREKYCESNVLPDNYFRWKRVSAKATTDCCPGKRDMVIYLSEEANVDVTNRDENKKPSFEWGETYATMKGKKILIHTLGEFDIHDPQLTYYRQPKHIQIDGTVNPYTGEVSTQDVTCEFKEDLIELMIDEAVKILSGDIEALNQAQRQSQNVEANN